MVSRQSLWSQPLAREQRPGKIIPQRRLLRPEPLPRLDLVSAQQFGDDHGTLSGKLNGPRCDGPLPRGDYQPIARGFKHGAGRTGRAGESTTSTGPRIMRTGAPGRDAKRCRFAATVPGANLVLDAKAGRVQSMAPSVFFRRRLEANAGPAARLPGGPRPGRRSSAAPASRPIRPAWLPTRRPFPPHRSP